MPRASGSCTLFVVAIVVETGQLPLLVIRFVGRYDEDEFDRYLSTYRRLLVREDRLSTVVDARTARAPSGSQARKQAQFMREHADLLRAKVAGTAFVIETSMIRGALKAILRLQAMPHDYVVMEAYDPAVAWARAKLAEAEVPLRRAE